MKPKQSSSLLSRCLSVLGPGWVTGAADDDPSGIVTYSIVGARYGMSLLWMAWVTWPLMAAVQMMCARIGMVTGHGLAYVLTKKFSKPTVAVFCVALLAANTINIAADLAGMADAAELLTGVPALLYVVIFAVGIAVAIVRCRYALLTSILKWLVLSLFAYAVTAFLIHPPWSEVARHTFLPAFPRGQAMWEAIVAILGTTISPYLFFWQSAQEVEQQKAEGRLMFPMRGSALRATALARMADVGAGTFLSNLIMFFIILTAALSLRERGITDVTSSREAAEALRPLGGSIAVALYALAIVAAGLLSIPTLAGSAGYAFSETFGWVRGLDKKLGQASRFYAIILLSVTLAVAIDFLGINPMQSLFWSAVVNGILAPFLLVGILMAARDPDIMNKRPSSPLNQLVVGITTLGMFAAGFIMLYGAWTGSS